MRLNSIQQKTAGRYIKNYLLNYTNKEGNNKEYEMVSRNDIEKADDIAGKVNAVSIVPIDLENDRILILKEFRMALNRHILNFPAGLIDDNETVLEAAKRELKEETGLDVVDTIRILPPTFSSSGLTDERVQIVIVNVSGELDKSLLEENEEIECLWYHMSEIDNIIKNEENIGARTQLCLLALSMAREKEKSETAMCGCDCSCDSNCGHNHNIDNSILHDDLCPVRYDSQGICNCLN